MESTSAGRLICRGENQSAKHPEGFSLLEMMMVVTLILIVATISAPIYRTAAVRTREALLHDHLFTLRTVIDRFTLDNGRSQEPEVRSRYGRFRSPEVRVFHTVQRGAW